MIIYIYIDMIKRGKDKNKVVKERNKKQKIKIINNYIVYIDYIVIKHIKQIKIYKIN